MLFDAILTLLFSYVWKKLFVVVILFCCLDCVVVLIMAGFISSLIWLYLFFWVKWIGRNFFVNTNFFGGFEFGRFQPNNWMGGGSEYYVQTHISRPLFSNRYRSIHKSSNSGGQGIEKISITSQWVYFAQKKFLSFLYIWYLFPQKHLIYLRLPQKKCSSKWIRW